MRFQVFALLIIPILNTQQVIAFIHSGATTPYSDINGRGPLYSYNAKSDLLPAGMRQSYLLGTLFKDNYVDSLAIPQLYNPFNFNFRSIMEDGCLMTAQSFIWGLFNETQTLTDAQLQNALPPLKLSINQNDINNLGRNTTKYGQTIAPIYAYNATNDIALWPSMSCKQYQSYKSSAKQTNQYLQVVNSYCQQFISVGTKFGIPSQTVCDVNEMKDVAFNIMSIWYTDYCPPSMTQADLQLAQTIYFNLSYVENTYDPLMQKLSLFNAFNDIKYYLSTAISNYTNSNTKRFVSYFTNDEIIMNLLSFLNYSPQSSAIMMSNIIMELNSRVPSSTNTSDYYLNIYFNGEPIPVNGSTNINYNSLMASIQNIMTFSNWTLECLN